MKPAELTDLKERMIGTGSRANPSEAHVHVTRYTRATALRLLKAVVVVLLPLVLFTSCGGGSPLTYLSLGDSLAVGVGASDPRELGYAPLYKEVLEERRDREVDLIQLGLSGETSESFVNGQDSQLARAEAVIRENPGAIVTLSIGGNDLLQTADGGAAEREAAIARYAGNLDLILERLKNASEPPPSITILTLYNPAPGSFTDEWSGSMNDEVREVAARNGVRVAEAGQVFESHEAEYVRHARYPWDIHPTDRGYEALAGSLSEASGT